MRVCEICEHCCIFNLEYEILYSVQRPFDLVKDQFLKLTDANMINIGKVTCFQRILSFESLLIIELKAQRAIWLVCLI